MANCNNLFQTFNSTIKLDDTLFNFRRIQADIKYSFFKLLTISNNGFIDFAFPLILKKEAFKKCASQLNFSKIAGRVLFFLGIFANRAIKDKKNIIVFKPRKQINLKKKVALKLNK